MSKINPLYPLLRIHPEYLTELEINLLEAELFTRLCNELTEHFRTQYQGYFHLMKFTAKKENDMLEEKFACLIIKDIILSGEYNLEGIAYYTDSHAEVVEDIMIGSNTNPSASFLRKLIDLHRLVRQELYGAIIKKIAVECAAVA